MAHSLDLDALFRTLALHAHALCAEMSGLPRADREDVAQGALMHMWQTCGGAATVGAVALVLRGVLDLEVLLAQLRAVVRNLARNWKKGRRVRRREQGMSTPALDAFAAAATDLPPDWLKSLTAEERTWLEAFKSKASDEELTKVWGVSSSTVSRRRSRLKRRLDEIREANR